MFFRKLKANRILSVYKSVGVIIGVSKQLEFNKDMQKVRKTTVFYVKTVVFMAKVHEVDTILQESVMQQQFCAVLFR